jgi:hypothetical protein
MTGEYHDLNKRVYPHWLGDMTSIQFEQVLMVAYPHWGYREAPCKREVTEAFLAMQEIVVTCQGLS